MLLQRNKKIERVRVRAGGFPIFPSTTIFRENIPPKIMEMK